MKTDISFKEALRLLRTWEAKHVKVTISNRHGVELASVWGVLGDHSTDAQLEFGLDEPGNPTATVPMSWGGPFRCAVDDMGLSVTTGDGAAVRFSPTQAS